MDIEVLGLEVPLQTDGRRCMRALVMACVGGVFSTDDDDDDFGFVCSLAWVG